MAAGGPSLTRLYTRTGDHGETGLAGGQRVAKDSPRVRAFGSLDEAGATLGLARAELAGPADEVSELLVRLQHELFIAQSELATSPSAAPAHRIQRRHVERLETDIDRFASALEPSSGFVLPGGSRAGALLHLARTTCRRAEREIWALHRREPQRPELLEWTNRLSDLLFALALAVNRRGGASEIAPDYSV